MDLLMNNFEKGETEEILNFNSCCCFSVLGWQAEVNVLLYDKSYLTKYIRWLKKYLDLIYSHNCLDSKYHQCIDQSFNLTKKLIYNRELYRRISELLIHASKFKIQLIRDKAVENIFFLQSPCSQTIKAIDFIEILIQVCEIQQSILKLLIEKEDYNKIEHLINCLTLHIFILEHFLCYLDDNQK